MRKKVPEKSWDFSSLEILEYNLKRHCVLLKTFLSLPVWWRHVLMSFTRNIWCSIKYTLPSLSTMFCTSGSCAGDAGRPMILKGNDGTKDILDGLTSWGAWMLQIGSSRCAQPCFFWLMVDNGKCCRCLDYLNFWWLKIKNDDLVSHWWCARIRYCLFGWFGIESFLPTVM